MNQKCLFLASHYRDKYDFGGQRSRYSAESFARYFSEVKVILPIVDTYSGKKIQKKPPQGKINFSYIYTIQFNRGRLTRRFFSQLFYTFFVCLKIVQLRFSYKYLILNNSPVLGYFPIGILLRLLRYRYILDQRDVPFDVLIESYPKVFGWLDVLHDLIYHGAHGTISNSKGIRERLTKNTETDFVIELGFDDGLSIAHFEPKSIIGDQASLVYVGSHNRYFNLFPFVQRLYERRFKGTLNMYLSKNPFNKEEMEKFYFLEYRGSCSKKDLHDAIKQNDIGIFPIVKKDFSLYLLGNKVFDYLSAGLLVCVPMVDKSECEYFTKSLGAHIQEESIFNGDIVERKINTDSLKKFENKSTMDKIYQAIAFIFKDE